MGFLTTFSKKRIIINLSVLVGLFLIWTIIAFRGLGNWLTVTDVAPQNVDLIFTFAGDLDRFEYSKDLYTHYPQATWFISTAKVPVFDTITLATIVRRNLIMTGFNTNRIIINDTCTTTFGELSMLRDYLDSLKRADSRFVNRPVMVALVSSPYHIRRIILEAKRVIGTDHVKFYRQPVPIGRCYRNPLHPADWWKHEYDAKDVFSEIIKIIYYRVKYR